MEILVLGFYNKNNIGDESYKQTFTKLFPQHSLTFVDSLQKEAIDKCEAVLLGGGNVIRNGFLKQLIKYKPKRIYAFSAGQEEDLGDQPLPPFKHIYARDKATLATCQAKKIPCTLIPDAALTLEGDPVAGKKWIEQRFKDEKRDLYEKVVVVVVNNYLINGGLEDLSRDAFTFIKFSYDFARIIDETCASFIFLPFGTGMPYDDRVANSWVANKCKYWKKNCVIWDQLDVDTTMNVIAAANLSISSRLHSSIFSFASGTPFIDITHHSKNEMFLEMIGKKDNSVSFWNMDNRLLKNKIDSMINTSKHTEHVAQREKIREQVNAIHFDK